MAITYDAPSNIITVVGIGYDFADVLAADVAGAWGVVSCQGGHQYLIEAHLLIGDNSTTTDLTDDNVQIQIGTSGVLRWLKVQTNAVLTIGVLNNGLYDTSYGLTGNALTLYFTTAYPVPGYVSSSGTINLYGVALWVYSGIRFKITGTVDFRNIVHSGAGAVFLTASGQILRSTISNGSSYGFMVYTPNITLSDIVCENRQDGIVCGFSGVDVTARDSWFNPSVRYPFRGHPYAGNQIISAYDCDYDIYKVYTYNTGYDNPDKHFDDYKSFALRVGTDAGVAIQSATVTITDMFGTDIVDTTDVNGDITEVDLLSFIMRNKGVSSGTGISKNDYVFYTPYTVKIENAGYKKQELTLDLLRDDWKSGVNLTMSLQRISINSDLESL